MLSTLFYELYLSPITTYNPFSMRREDANYNLNKPFDSMRS